MKQTIEIEVPDGKKAVWKDGNVIFEDIKPQLPKSWREFCEQNKIKEGEFFLDDNCYIEEIWVGKRHESHDRNILPNKQAAEQHLALMQLHQLRDCYRQGWIPDYTNDSKKWNVRKYTNKISIGRSYGDVAFLSFQTIEIAELFVKNFRDLIEQAGDLI